jgi:hypothetical protein
MGEDVPKHFSVSRLSLPADIIARLSLGSSSVLRQRLIRYSILGGQVNWQRFCASFFQCSLSTIRKNSLESIENLLCQPDIHTVSFALLIHARFIRSVVIEGKK